ncbi:GRF zinc finger containing protein [Striga asiatica]|uniref:GRF zinc finger containing protein n=1 Tax=Striga asiatica TaxID=4170 RepID=A0A5A7RF09_STRAF|nr:GRF zinc finger containing protein [Striga asiatica]
MATSSTNSGASNGSATHTQVRCYCPDEAILLISQTDANPGRRYFRCPNRKFKDCKFFLWCDPEIPPSQKAAFLKFKNERKGLGDELKCKEEEVKMITSRLDIIEREMASRLDIIEREMVELQVKHAKLEEFIDTLVKKEKFPTSFVMFMLACVVLLLVLK